MVPDDLASLTIAETAPRLQRKELSPVELTRSYLDRIDRLNQSLNAYFTVLHDQAMSAAHTAEEEIRRGRYRGPLHGIPIAVKDLFAIKGVPMTCGSKILADHVPDYDAAVVTKLREGGAVLLGKTNMHEFAWGATSINPHYGTPRNPWDLNCFPGGSSGGSAVAVGASLAMGALGTDTGGSIRIPASISGIVGIKPTYGRVTRAGVYPLCSSLDHVGPMTKSVADAALLLEVLAGHDPSDPNTSRVPVPRYSDALTGEIRGLRVGVATGYFQAFQPAISDAVAAAVRHLQSLGAVVEEVSLPLMRYVPGASFAIIVSEAFAVHERFLQTRADEYGADVLARLTVGTYVTAPQYLKAQRVRRLLRDQSLQALEHVDVLVVPATPMTAKPIDQPVVRFGDEDIIVVAHLARFTRPSNLTGLPAISLPCGFDEQGLPIGLQIIGRSFDESTVLRVAHAYESSTEWHKRQPPLPG